MNFLRKNIFKTFLIILRVFPPEISSFLSLKSIKLIANLNRNLLNARPKKRFEKIKVSNLEFEHLIGLSAGIDKSGDYFHSLSSIGFSFIEIGTFTPKAQTGNDFPRIKRIHKDYSLINRLGFNNPGIEAAIENIETNKKKFSGILGISIGKNKGTSLENAFTDYNFCIDKCFHHADYIAINISSPNTKDLRKLTSPDYIRDLSKEISSTKTELENKKNKRVPIFLKLSPDEKDENIQKLVSLTLTNGFDGYIVSNTTLGEFGGISGGISGELLKAKSNEMLKKVNSFAGNEATLIASGGISTKGDVEERLKNGADLIQVYTSFIYKGPSILEELLI